MTSSLPANQGRPNRHQNRVATPTALRTPSGMHVGVSEKNEDEVIAGHSPMHLWASTTGRTGDNPLTNALSRPDWAVRLDLDEP